MSRYRNSESRAFQKVFLNTFSGSPGRAKAVSDKKVNSYRFVPQYLCLNISAIFIHKNKYFLSS